MKYHHVRDERLTVSQLPGVAKLEGPHCYEEEANQAQSKRIILATWKEVATIYRKQALDKQNNYKTDLDIWHRNLGLCQ